MEEVVVDKVWDEGNRDKWLESAKRSIQMFNEAGIVLRYWDGKTIEKITKFRRGEMF